MNARIDTAAEMILRNWEEWEGEAGQTAQVEQDPEAGEAVMFEHIRDVLRSMLVE